MKILQILFVICCLNYASVSLASTTEILDEITPQDLAKYLTILPEDVVEGRDKAEILVIEYSSLSCPHCAFFHQSTYPKLKAQYIDTGKIKYIQRPFAMDVQSLRGAMLAICAGKDQYYKMLDALFASQSSWVLSKNYFELLENIARLDGMSGEKFWQCMENKDLENQILQTRLIASTNLKIQSTPTFFINGAVYHGALNIEKFSQILDEILNKSNK